MVVPVLRAAFSVLRLFGDNYTLDSNRAYDREFFQGFQDSGLASSSLYILGKFCCDSQFFDMEAESVRLRSMRPEYRINLCSFTRSL